MNVVGFDDVFEWQPPPPTYTHTLSRSLQFQRLMTIQENHNINGPGREGSTDLFCVCLLSPILTDNTVPLPVCVCVYVCVCMCVCVCVCVCVCACVHVCMWCVCARERVREGSTDLFCVCLLSPILMCVCVYVFVCVGHKTKKSLRSSRWMCANSCL